MARLSYSRHALKDLERISDFLRVEGVDAVLNALDLIEDALTVLQQHPLIGRPVDAHLRELVISQGKSGFVALYSFEEAFDAVLILAIRHQREAGFRT